MEHIKQDECDKYNDIFSNKYFDYHKIEEILPEELKSLFFYPENHDEYVLLFNTQSFDKKNSCSVIVYNCATQSETRQAINIWQYNYDYWFRHGVFNKIIFILDYSGLKVYNMSLQLLYHYYDDKLFNMNVRDHKLVYYINKYILISSPSKHILHEFEI